MLDVRLCGSIGNGVLVDDYIGKLRDATEVSLLYDPNTDTYYLEGESVQSGIPTPDNPIEIQNNFKAGKYKTIINGVSYFFSISDDLRGIKEVKDRLTLDINNKTCIITRKIGVTDTKGASWSIYSNPVLVNTICFRSTELLPNNWYTTEALCSHFERKITVLRDVEGFSHGDNTGKIYFTILRDSVAGIPEWLEWINANKPYIVYILSAPVIEVVDIE